MTATDSVRQEFVQLWARMGPFWGVPPTTARVYAWLLSQEGSADADSIMKGLGMSRGAVSMACRELRDWNLVTEQRAPGSRRIAYLPETDLERAIRSIVQTRKRREWDPILDLLDDWIPQVAMDRSSEARVFRERMEDIRSLVGVADSMAESFLRGGVVQRLGLKALVATARKKATRRKGSKR